MTRELNDRQLRFVHEYLKDQNASAAAIRAGYSPNTKGAHAAELMRNPLIRERIDDGLARLYTALDITAENQLRQLARIAYLDVRRLFDAGGNPLPIAQWPDDLAQAMLVNFDQKRGGDWTRRVRQPARLQALLALERRLAKAGNLRGRDEQEAAAVTGEKPAGGFFTRLFERKTPIGEAPAGDEVVQDEAARDETAGELAVVAEEISAESAPPEQALSAREEAQGDAPAPAEAAGRAEAKSKAADYPAGASPFDPDYDFRKDPAWMWGGRYRFKVCREPEAPPPEPLERLPDNFRVRAGATIPAKEMPGFIPPYLRRERPAVAETGPVFDDD